jgi:hypothetical protein
MTPDHRIGAGDPPPPTGAPAPVALVWPPACDPTMPCVSVPLLAACLRSAGFPVLPVDANVEALAALLRPDPLAAHAERVADAFRALDRRRSLSHEEQLRYVTLYDALADPEVARAPRAIAESVATLRDPARFFDRAAYDAAVGTVQAALRLTSAAHAPLEFDLVAWRTPFALLDAAELRRDAAPDRDPFHVWTRDVLAPRLRTAGVRLVGVSVVFPAQLQPAWSLAWTLRQALPELVLVVGGPALTQRVIALPPGAAEPLLPPFDAAVLFEGEQAIVDLARAVERGERPRGVLRGAPPADLASVPAPDFAGLPFEAYLAPAPVLPYDDTRGCYFGRCAFCHYGLAETGTACYRERPTERVVADLAALHERHGARVFYLSHDTLAPRSAERLARAVRAAGLPVRWAGDIRPERSLGRERCQALAAGGALALSVGLESGAERVLRAIGKGVTVEDAAGAIRNLAVAGVAVEAMTFGDFPTETRDEALATLRLLADLRDAVALWVYGTFELTPGARMAAEPERYGLRPLRRVGSGLAVKLLWEERRRAKTPADREQVDAAVARLARGWRLRPYPWAGSLSTAHTLLWLEKEGPATFRDQAKRSTSKPLRPPSPPRARHDVHTMADHAWQQEAAIWQDMIAQGDVSRAAYDRGQTLRTKNLNPRPEPRRRHRGSA